MGEITRRAAELTDMKAVWTLLRETAGEIGLDLSTEAAQEAALSEIMAGCTSGLSPIAIADDNSVVGALLVKRDPFEWFFKNGASVHVTTAAVAPAHRDNGVLASLLADVQAAKAPILASVKTGDKLGLGDVLTKAGFANEGAAEAGWGDVYRWKPQA